MPKKKMHFVLLLTSVFAMLLLLSGCVEEVVVNADELKRPDASVRFIQADESQGTTTISIYGRLEDADKIVATITVDYANASQYYTIPAGARRVKIQSAKMDEERNITFTSFFQTSLILYNGTFTNAYERYLYSDEAGNLGADTASVRFCNLIDRPVYIPYGASGGAPYFGNPSSNYTIAAGGGTYGYAKLKAGNYTFRILDDVTDVFYTELNFDVNSNVRYTTIAFGTANNPIVKVFTDDGK